MLTKVDDSQICKTINSAKCQYWIEFSLYILGIAAITMFVGSVILLFQANSTGKIEMSGFT